MGHIFGMIARWMDTHEMPGWVTFGPNGKALAWAPTERTIRAMRRRIDGAHDYARCSDGFVPLADIWQRDIGEEAAVQASDRAFMIGESIYVAALLTIATIVTLTSTAHTVTRARTHLHVHADHYGQMSGVSAGTDTLYCSFEHGPGVIVTSCQSGN